MSARNQIASALIGAVAAIALTHGSLAEKISLEEAGGVYHVPVKINGVLSLPFIIDTGAADVSIPSDVVLTLIRSGTIRGQEIREKKKYSQADGSILEARTFIIRKLQVGNTRVHDVLALVSPAKGDLLLGQTFLRRLPSWRLDSQNGVLHIDSPDRPLPVTVSQL